LCTTIYDWHAGGTCQEFTPLLHRLVSEIPEVAFGQVDIDTTAGMQLAAEVGALEDGVPNVRAYMTTGDRKGRLVWSGEEVPSFHELRIALLTVVPPDANVKLHLPKK
jgi:hypothetical protein